MLHICYKHGVLYRLQHQPDSDIARAEEACLQISGVISLSCAWRVTPLDVVTMKVKQKQAEVDRKEEMLALLQVRILCTCMWTVTHMVHNTEHAYL